jgi:hypothetical protein
MRLGNSKWPDIANKWKNKYGHIKLNAEDENDEGTS